MSIVVQYGSHTHAVGEVEYSIQRTAILSDAKTPVKERVQIDVSGMLTGSSVADIDAKVESIKAAYAIDGQDFIIRSGSLVLDVSLISSQAEGGTRVIQRPSFPNNKGGAYTTFLPYALTIEAELPIDDPITSIKSWRESVSFTGGGPLFGMLETRVGRPQPQLLTRHTIYRAVQEGQAVGNYVRPSAALPLFPSAQIKMPNITKISATPVGLGNSTVFINPGIRWRYEFESATPLVANPNNWGAT